MKRIIGLTGLMIVVLQLHAQIDSTLLNISLDTTKKGMNMDAIYNRPFIMGDQLPVAIGGYMEVNWQHLGTDGLSEGHQFQFRRMTLFVSSTIGNRIKFLSELEFEDGGKEIALEFAAVDMELHPMLNIRGGIILNPIGAFNQNHDGPRWEFTDRPISASQLLPATWSNAGFGLFGKFYRKKWMFGYEMYATGNFDDNGENRTFLPAAKANPERFEEINSGLPLLTGKFAVKNDRFGELGLSYMGGVFNKFQDDGLQLDDKRRLDVFAVDVNTKIAKTGTSFTGEWTWIFVDVPASYTQQYGDKQVGGFLDIVQPIFKKKLKAINQSTLNLACRLEYIDWNVGSFVETGGNIGDELWSIMPGISYRPTSGTVIRWNYRIQQDKDLLENPVANTRGFIFGISSYF